MKNKTKITLILKDIFLKITLFNEIKGPLPFGIQ
jgi:hypothetical protein